MSIQLYLSDGRKLTPGFIEESLLSALNPQYAIYRPRNFDDFLDTPDDLLLSIVVVDDNFNIVEESFVPTAIARLLVDGPVYFLDAGPAPPISQLIPISIGDKIIYTRFLGNESKIPIILNLLPSNE